MNNKCAISSERSVFASPDGDWSDTAGSPNNHLNAGPGGRVQTNRHALAPAGELFNCGRQDRLELRVLFLPRNDPDVDLFKPGVFEQAMQLHFAESEPAIGIKFSRLFESVT